ncbi:helix-turn-helix domain-containing protein [Thermaurantiacus sp.]
MGYSLDPADVLQLSELQKRCLRGVLSHLNTRQIAAELGLSDRQVEVALRSAIKKLGVSSRKEAALLLAATEGNFPNAMSGSLQAPEVPGWNINTTNSPQIEPFTAIRDADSVPSRVAAESDLEYFGCDQSGDAWVGRTETSALRVSQNWALQLDQNRLSTKLRLILIVVVSACSALLFSSVLVAVATLSALR